MEGRGVAQVRSYELYVILLNCSSTLSYTFLPKHIASLTVRDVHHHKCFKQISEPLIYGMLVYPLVLR